MSEGSHNSPWKLLSHKHHLCAQCLCIGHLKNASPNSDIFLANCLVMLMLMICSTDPQPQPKPSHKCQDLVFADDHNLLEACLVARWPVIFSCHHRKECKAAMPTAVSRKLFQADNDCSDELLPKGRFGQTAYSNLEVTVLDLVLDHEQVALGILHCWCSFQRKKYAQTCAVKALHKY